MARTILHEELHQKPEVIEHQLAHKVSGHAGHGIQPHQVPEGAQSDDAAMGGLSGQAEGGGGSHTAARGGGMMSNPIDDLMMAEATLDLLRLACEKDFAGDRFECKQESAAYAATTPSSWCAMPA